MVDTKEVTLHKQALDWYEITTSHRKWGEEE